MKMGLEQFDQDWEEIEPRVRFSGKNKTPVGKAIIIEMRECLGKAYMRLGSGKATIEDLILLSRYPKFAITNEHYSQAVVIEDRVSMTTILSVMSRADSILEESNSKFRRKSGIAHDVELPTSPLTNLPS
jgi:hypothetical protein